MTLLELAERCEQASGPDRELDADIDKSLGYSVTFHAGERTPLRENTGMGFVRVPNYTASLDAAMALVPGPDWEWSLEVQAGSVPANGHQDGMIAIVKIGDPLRRWEAEALTPALALTAAALRARAQQESQP